VTATNAYDELSGQRLDSGRGYDKRSVETFRARALDLVDELLRQVTELQDRLAAGSEPALSEAELDLVTAFRSADSFRRREALAVLGRSSAFTWSPTDDADSVEGDAPTTEDALTETDLNEWLQGFAREAESTLDDDVAVLDLVDAPAEQERTPLRVTTAGDALDPPVPTSPWAGWLD
jgi:hypothetical protein